MKEFETQSLMPVYRGIGHGRNLRGIRLESFTQATATNALSVWEEINVRRSDANQDITAQDYREFAERVGYLGHNVLGLGLEWSKSDNPFRKPLGEAIILSQSVGSILTGADRLIREYPEAKVDMEDLIQEGIIKSWTLFNKLSRNGNVGKVLVSIARTTFDLGRNQIKEAERQQTSEFKAYSTEELEQGEFVTANLDSVIDPVKEVERKELRQAVAEAVDSLVETPAKMAQEIIDLDRRRVVRETRAKQKQVEEIKQGWTHWLQLARYGGIAAVIVLSLIGSTRLVSATVENELQVKLHNGQSLGVIAEWSELGPIEPTKPEWIGDGFPLVPSQIKNRKSVDVSTRGVRFGETGEKRVPVVKRDSEGKVLSTSAYSDDPVGRVVLEGDQYIVKLENGKAKPEDRYIDCQDEHFENRITIKAPVSREAIEENCTWVFSRFEWYDPAKEENRAIWGGGGTKVGNKP